MLSPLSTESARKAAAAPLRSTKAQDLTFRYLYMEPMEADLHQIVRSGQALSNAHIQYFTYQLLRGMKVSYIS